MKLFVPNNTHRSIFLQITNYSDSTTVVVGHWLKDRTEGHRGFWSTEDQRTNLWRFTTKMQTDLFEFLIAHYTLPGDYVAHLFPSNGM